MHAHRVQRLFLLLSSASLCLGAPGFSIKTTVEVFSGNRAFYNSRQILEAPEQGRYYNFYYAQGRLFLCHTHRGETGGFTRILAIPWTTSDPKADLSKAVSVPAKYLGATPFAWGQWRDEVLTVSNQGSVHVFKGGKWRTGMVPLGNGLILSTSSKGEYKFLTEAQRREYGAVICLKMPGNLAAKIRWTNRPIDLEFRVDKNRMTILQDGQKLTSSTAPKMIAGRLRG